MRVLVSCFCVVLYLVVALGSFAQNAELSLGWAHATGDFGVDGVGLGGAIWFTNRVSIGANYDTMWDTSRIGSFELTSIGETSVKSHLQNFMVGPRVFFANKKIHKRSLQPFGEVQFGGSHLNTKIQQVNTGEISASDNAFTWLLGGGADVVLNPHWAARGNLDLERTHFSDSGQTRLRFLLGVAYTFARRKQ
jgi:Outer membrane protein beta-barrel domain